MFLNRVKLSWILIPGVLVFGLGLFFYGRYAFDKKAPDFTFKGIENGEYYSKRFEYQLDLKDNYKIKDVSIWLDNKLIIDKKKIGRKNFELGLSLDTMQLVDGRHNLRVLVNDGAKKRNFVEKDIDFFVDNLPLQAHIVPKDFRALQGDTLHVVFKANKDLNNPELLCFGKSCPCVKVEEGDFVYEAFVPVACEADVRENMFKLSINDFVGNDILLENNFRVMPREFRRQYVLFTQEKQQDIEENGRPQKELKEYLEKALLNSPKKKLWRGRFDLPLDSKGISTEFGVLRTKKGRGKYHHAAVDLRGIPKCVIWAAQDGVVIAKDYYQISGKTVVIDHGCGVFSMYFHLDDFADINVGDKILKGEAIGTMGKTGYATGYHLHWEMSVQGVSVNPLQWTEDF